MPKLAIISPLLSCEGDCVTESSDDPLAPLVKGIAEGNESALERFYDQTVEKAYAVANAILRNNQDADEAVLDAYAQVWRTADRYSSGRGTPLAWLIMITRSRALDMLRKQKRDTTVTSFEEPSTDEDPMGLLELMQAGSTVRAALEALSTPQLHVLSLSFYRDLSHAEIAQTLQLPLGTVKSHARRALAALKSELEVRTA